MDDETPHFKRAVTGPLLVAGSLLILALLVVHQPSATGQSEVVTEEDAVELAPYMTQLQTLTHKLGLSIEHSNHRLADFYLYETLLLRRLNSLSSQYF